MRLEPAVVSQALKLHGATDKEKIKGHNVFFRDEHEKKGLFRPRQSLPQRVVAVARKRRTRLGHSSVADAISITYNAMWNLSPTQRLLLWGDMFNTTAASDIKIKWFHCRFDIAKSKISFSGMD